MSGREHIVPLLQLYAEYPMLWDVNDHNYRKAHVRNETFRVMIKKLGANISLIELKNRIKNLRTTYNRELQKVIAHENRGELYTPCLSWFPVADKFLRPIAEGRYRGKFSNCASFTAEAISDDSDPDVAVSWDELDAPDDSDAEGRACEPKAKRPKQESESRAITEIPWHSLEGSSTALVTYTPRHTPRWQPRRDQPSHPRHIGSRSQTSITSPHQRRASSLAGLPQFTRCFRQPEPTCLRRGTMSMG